MTNQQRSRTSESTGYPLQRQFAVFGVIAGVIGAALFGSVVAGFALFSLFFNTGLLWRREEAPILPFCLGYQWLFAVAGFLWLATSGSYPGDESVGNIQGAVSISLLALTCLALGIRWGIRFWDHCNFKGAARMAGIDSQYNLHRLFLVTFAANLIGLFWKPDPMNMWFGGAQIIYRLLELKSVLLVLLWLSIFRQGTGYGYALAAGLLVLVSSFGSTMSAFSFVFMLFLVAILREWRPWLFEAVDQIRNRRVVTAAIAVTLAVFTLGLIWEGGVKAVWRSQVLTEEGATVGPRGFLQTVQEQAPTVRFRTAVESVAARMSSDALYFSYVLDRVPGAVPHENGALTRRALTHVIMPRFLFPNKPNLGGDSWLVIQYAGIEAADDEQGASIGLGYIAEFYIDYGIPVMFIPIIIYGIIIGLVYRSLQWFSPSHAFWMSAATIMCFGPLASYGGELAKLLGALVHGLIIYGIILFAFGRRLHEWLLVEPIAGARLGSDSR